MRIRPDASKRRGTADPITRRVRSPLTTLAFWVAVALPALYLPVFLADLVELGAFLALVGVHLLALVGGRHHRRDADRVH